MAFVEGDEIDRFLVHDASLRILCIMDRRCAGAVAPEERPGTISSAVGMRADRMECHDGWRSAGNREATSGGKMMQAELSAMVSGTDGSLCFLPQAMRCSRRSGPGYDPR
jgi:hypothetical protein